MFLIRVSVSRTIKPLVESDGRSSDYFSQKNCAQQYSSMLDKAGTHKRKRSTEGSAEGGECRGKCGRR
jgi:bromodomain-containing protein 8